MDSQSWRSEETWRSVKSTELTDFSKMCSNVKYRSVHSPHRQTKDHRIHQNRLQFAPKVSNVHDWTSADLLCCIPTWDAPPQVHNCALSHIQYQVPSFRNHWFAGRLLNSLIMYPEIPTGFFADPLFLVKFSIIPVTDPADVAGREFHVPPFWKTFFLKRQDYLF